MDSKDRRKISGKKPSQRKSYREFVTVRFAGCFEPGGWTVRFEANETEGRTSIELLKISVHMEPQWAQLFLRPDEKISEPARPSKWSDLWLTGVQIQFAKRSLDCIIVLDGPSKLTHRRIARHPTGSFGCLVAVLDRFQDGVVS